MKLKIKRSWTAAILSAGLFIGAMATVPFEAALANKACNHCGAVCSDGCSAQYPNDPAKFGSCYGGCVVGCVAACPPQPD